MQISFNVTETKTGNVKNTGDLAFTVEGTKDTTKAVSYTHLDVYKRQDGDRGYGRGKSEDSD